MIESIEDYEERWKIQGKLNSEDKSIFWKEHKIYHEQNPGLYFRNNVWWWRPLWEFVCYACDDILDQKDMTSGSYNDGHEISKKKSKLISQRLHTLVKDGTVKQHEEEYEKDRKDLENSDVDKDHKWASNYPFSEENVIAFGEFCEESGGFIIC
jgi:hypothetical protein